MVGGPAGIAAADVFGYRALWVATLVLGLFAAAGLRLMPALPGFHLQSEPRDGEATGAPRTEDA